MKFLLFSLLAILSACTSYYKGIKPLAVDMLCIEKIKPSTLQTAWYAASIDVVGKHISGLLFIKQMEKDSTTRIVFANEAGITFFDFEFKKDGSFQVKQIIDQLNKKPVLETFRKDFSLLLALPFNKTLEGWQHNDQRYYGVTDGSEKYYFVTNVQCDSVTSLQIGSKRKLKVSINKAGANTAEPELITIKHHTFNMTIKLKKLDKNVN